MIERVINRKNMHLAYRHVMQNKGSAGVDGMSLSELKHFVKQNREAIATSMLNGRYLPQAILGVSIPKSEGKSRLLGIPTVSERWLQQCVAQVITPLFEFEFKEHSYGFRPNKNAHQCLGQAHEYIHQGYQHIVDIDLKAFFDEVDHCLLLQLLYNKVKCPLVLRLIRKWLRAPMVINGVLTKRRKGIPQGSPLSPILSNIMLHELDKELEKRGWKYVRFADDFSIYTKSANQAKKAGNAIFLFLKNKLKLPISRQKSGIRKPVQFQILGYRFVPMYQKGTRGKYQMVVSEKGWKTLKEKLKSITRKTTPHSLAERIRQLKEVQRGWINYFRMASMVVKIRDLDGWVRNRLRYCIWHDWKKPERKRKNLMRLGVERQHAYLWSRTRKGGWAVAQSPILGTTVTLERLRKRGYESMLEHYLKVSSQFNEPLYTRPVRTVV
ncbi:MAG: group II intron reverse transcriptase/maturase [Williamsia sp.]|nr:group II intron reverse transcriptase/maturase [Williamsia sp.]